jgi:hypothetical protein
MANGKIGVLEFSLPVPSVGQRFLIPRPLSDERHAKIE